MHNRFVSNSRPSFSLSRIDSCAEFRACGYDMAGQPDVQFVLAGPARFAWRDHMAKTRDPIGPPSFTGAGSKPV